jgi:hypothetical protein
LLQKADPWLTCRTVEGFDGAEFQDLPQHERDELAKEVAAFRDIAAQVPAERPASARQSKQARAHLEKVMTIVGDVLLREWLDAQNRLMKEATAAAKSQGWYVEVDQKKLHESLLGDYKAPRLFITTRKKQEVVLNPIARFGSGRQGVVDLAVMPTFETAYLVTFKNDTWSIVSLDKSPNRRRPFSQATLVKMIADLPEN